MEERLQKILAQANLGSRRACEEIISAGRVSVNGSIASLGMKADPAKDRILVDGQPIRIEKKQIYVMLNKPRGVLSTVTTSDSRPTVRDLVDIPEQIFPVGRLDIDSEGLMLLTNDGDLANRLTHPRYGHEKEYRVLVARRPDEKQLQVWQRGVVLADGYKTAPAQVMVESTHGKGAWLRVILREGRKRQIPRNWIVGGFTGCENNSRAAGESSLGGLKPRQWRFLTPEEVSALRGKPLSKTKEINKTDNSPKQARTSGGNKFNKRQKNH